MPKKARAAREQPSPGPTPSVNAPVAGDSLRSTRIHYTTIDAPRGVKILEDIIEGFDKREWEAVKKMRLE